MSPNAVILECFVIMLGVVLPLGLAGLMWLERVPTEYCLGPSWREIIQYVRHQRALPRAVARRKP